MVVSPFCCFKLTASKPKPRGYPKELNTLGDHLRARRMDLALIQKDVANLFDVTVECVENWEQNRHPPTTKNRNKILEFLGSDSSFLPLEIRLGIMLKEYRKSENLSQTQLSRRIGIRQNLISDIETSRHRILRKTKDKILNFLSQNATSNAPT